MSFDSHRLQKPFTAGNDTERGNATLDALRL